MKPPEIVFLILMLMIAAIVIGLICYIINVFRGKKSKLYAVKKDSYLEKHYNDVDKRDDLTEEDKEVIKHWREEH